MRSMRRHIVGAECTAPSKTVGSRTAQLLNALYESGRTTFSYADVERIAGLQPELARR
jgi:hypothetical protein